MGQICSRAERKSYTDYSRRLQIPWENTTRKKAIINTKKYDRNTDFCGEYDESLYYSLFIKRKESQMKTLKETRVAKVYHSPSRKQIKMLHDFEQVL